jgi:hypothetical protein
MSSSNNPVADQRPEGPPDSTSREAKPAGRGRTAPLLRWCLRAALVSISVACLAVAAIRGRLSAEDLDANGAPIVTIDEGPRYGEALVRMGAEAPADDDIIRSAVRQAAGRGQRIVVAVTPGVPQREVCRVMGIIAPELPPSGQVYLTLAEAASQAE